MLIEVRGGARGTTHAQDPATPTEVPGTPLLAEMSSPRNVDYSQLGVLSESIHRVLSEKECSIFDRGMMHNCL
jgi:hypothetical protein